MTQPTPQQDPDYLTESLARFLDDAGARRPTPGGGSVSALVGALAAAVGQMVGHYTLGRAPSGGDEAVVQRAVRKLRRAELMLRGLMTEDMAAYRRYAQAARTPQRSRASEQELRVALSVAIAVPLEIATVAAATLRILDEMKDKANPRLLGDLAVGAVLAEAAAKAVAYNVRENLASLADAAEAQAVRDELAELLAEASDDARAVQRFVEERLFDSAADEAS